MEQVQMENDVRNNEVKNENTIEGNINSDTLIKHDSDKLTKNDLVEIKTELEYEDSSNHTDISDSVDNNSKEDSKLNKENNNLLDSNIKTENGIKEEENSLERGENESHTEVDKKKTHIELRNMLEDIEEGELDYGDEDDGELNEEDDLPDLPEYDPMAKEKKLDDIKQEGEEGEILSDNDENEEREEGEILDDDETGQVYICVDPVNDKWKKVSREEQKRMQELEDGQIDEPEERETIPSPTPQVTQPGRFIPRTLCKYFNNGLCRWGSTCRFLHPGINDKGIPSDMTPTWNATAGNYVMHRPPGMYPNAFGKAPSPMECVNIPVMPAPVVVNEMSAVIGGQTEYVNVVPIPVGSAAEITSGRKETAWERGLRKAKEVKEAASRRREEDEDFEEKRKSMRIPESKEIDYEMDGGLPPEWDIRDRESKEYYDRKYERRTEKYNSDKYYKKSQEIEKSMSRQRLSDLPPNHPARREEKMRREREKREREEEKMRKKESEEYRLKQKSYDKLASDVSARNATTKNIGSTEWHDPWMRTQPQQLQQTKAEGVEAISNSDSSSSDSDSDSDSSSSGSDSDGSGSSSSGHEGKFPNGRTDEERRKDRFRQKQERKTFPDYKKQEKGDSSYEEWKRQQLLQKQSNQNKSDSSYEEWKRQQLLQKQSNQNKNEARSSPRTTLPDPRTTLPDPRKQREEEKKERNQNETTEAPFPKSISNIPGNKKTTQNTPFKLQFGSSALTVRSKPAAFTNQHKNTQPKQPVVAKNEDKFDSPKRKETKDSDSDSDSSDSDSDNSNTDSSDSDSDDSDTDSDSDKDVRTKVAPTQTTGGVNRNFRSAPMDTNARKDIKLTLTEKPKIDPPVATAFGSKRPARKDELLKELKAVEDAIARKRAKID